MSIAEPDLGALIAQGLAALGLPGAASLAPSLFSAPSALGTPAPAHPSAAPIGLTDALAPAATEFPYFVGVDAVQTPAHAPRAPIPQTHLEGAISRFSPTTHIPHAAAGALDVASVRRDFPILETRVHGRPLVWLDNAATTQKPRAVIERLTRFYETENSNIHRAAHTLAARATDAYEAARDSVRRFLGASSTDEIVFVRGATEGINLLAKSWGAKHIGPGDEIVLSHLEHHSNIVPWQMLADTVGARLRVLPVDDRGQLRLEEAERIIGPRTKVVSVTHVSNALGTILPVAELARLAHRQGARIVVDGAQAVSHMPVDVGAIGADFYVFSGHKVFGPTGIGAVFGTPDAWRDTPPWQGGGNMITDVTFDATRYADAPARFEAGTGNIADDALRLPHDVAAYSVRAADFDSLDALATATLARVQRDGVCVVRAPQSQQRAIDATEPLIAAFERAGLVVRTTHFGRIEDLRPDNTTNANNDQRGYTTAPIELHTDQPFIAAPPRYQLLQAIVAAEGGDNAFVDGHLAGEYLRARDAFDHALLATTKVRFHRRQRAFESVIESPILSYPDTSNPTLAGFQIRYSYFTLAPHPLPFARMSAFYRAHDRFARIVRNPSHQLIAKLEAGDFVLYDNHRVLHARKPFSGPRWVRGVYFDPAESRGTRP
jgi:cysteine desulfurase/selenocysteine lyase